MDKRVVKYIKKRSVQWEIPSTPSGVVDAIPKEKGSR